jgi:hypothetical protein
MHDAIIKLDKKIVVCNAHFSRALTPMHEPLQPLTCVPLHTHRRM